MRTAHYFPPNLMDQHFRNYPLEIQRNYRKSPVVVEKSTISMAIIHSCVTVITRGCPLTAEEPWNRPDQNNFLFEVQGRWDYGTPNECFWAFLGGKKRPQPAIENKQKNSMTIGDCTTIYHYMTICACISPLLPISSRILPSGEENCIISCSFFATFSLW